MCARARARSGRRDTRARRDMIAGERDRLNKERFLHELNLQHKQLQYLLDRCNSWQTQATLITGFAFTAFSADALKDLDYVRSPWRSFFFVLSGALTMSFSIGVIAIASTLTSHAERLAMESTVFAAVAMVRLRMVWVFVPFGLSLAFLFISAVLLVFATCADEGEREALCDVSGGMTALTFFTMGCIGYFPIRLIRNDVAAARRAIGGPGDGSQMREPLRDGAGGSSSAVWGAASEASASAADRDARSI